jgi:uncharacterized protein (UPF0333 family)
MMRAVIPIAILAALVAVAPVAAMTSTSTRTASVVDTKSWCKAVIDANTKAGIMKNRRYVPVATVTPSAWKKIVDEAVANGSKYIALAPSSIKTAVRHQIAYFKNIKARNYSKSTPLAPMTLADVKKLNNFQRTKCGITFSG